MGTYGGSGYKQDYVLRVVLLYLCILSIILVSQYSFAIVFPKQKQEFYGLLELCRVRRKTILPVLTNEDNQFSVIKQTPLLSAQKVQPMFSKELHVLPMQQNPYMYTVSQVKTEPVIRKFIGNKEQKTLEEPIPSFAEGPSFSLVFVATPNRLTFLDEHLWRWSSNLVLVLFCKLSEQESTLQYMGERVLPERLTLILYIVPKRSKIFPINLLRNLGIRNVRTTHYVVMDMDMWPIPNLHSEMQKIPLRVLRDRKSAIIIPLLFFDLTQILPRCKSLRSCIQEDLEYFPNTVEELDSCLHSEMCRYNRGKLKTHSYTNDDWFQYALNPSAPPVLKIDCMLNAHQEPYYFLRRHKLTPLFDPSFINYGYNKMEHMDEIRAKDFNFYLVTHSFAMDMAHHKSEMGKQFDSLKKNPMDSVYARFKKKLEKEYGPQKYKGVCLGNKKQRPNSPVYALSVCYLEKWNYQMLKTNCD